MGLCGLYESMIHAGKQDSLSVVPNIFQAVFAMMAAHASAPYVYLPFKAALEYHGILGLGFGFGGASLFGAGRVAMLIDVSSQHSHAQSQHSHSTVTAQSTHPLNHPLAIRWCARHAPLQAPTRPSSSTLLPCST